MGPAVLDGRGGLGCPGADGSVSAQAPRTLAEPESLCAKARLARRATGRPRRRRPRFRTLCLLRRTGSACGRGFGDHRTGGALRLGLRLEPVRGLSWPQLLEAARRREIDMITTAAPLPERLDYLASTSS